MAREKTKIKDGTSNPQNAISNRTRAFAQRMEGESELSYLRRAVRERERSLHQQYGAVNGRFSYSNYRRINEASRNLYDKALDVTRSERNIPQTLGDDHAALERYLRKRFTGD